MRTDVRPSSPSFASHDINAASKQIQTLSDSVSAALESEDHVLEHGSATISRVPFGVCLAIAPWNAPFILASRAVATPIIAGNTVILKTSHLTPAIHSSFGQIFADAGLPPGVLNIIHVDESETPQIVEQLIKDKRVKHINFTGSTAVGRIIAQHAASVLKPTLLELGGKSSAIVLEDADLESAASHCLLGAWMHCGQICMSTERAIVVSSQYDQFVEVCKRLGESSYLRTSGQRHAMSKTTDNARSLIDDALSKGAKWVLKPESSFGPCVISDINDSMRLYHEESFSPILPIIRASSSEDALRIANDSDYALASSIFTSRPRSNQVRETGDKESDDGLNVHEMAMRLNAGATNVNFMTIHDHPSLPHGGNLSSGYGRFNGIEGIRNFTTTKVITYHDPSIMPL